MGKYSNAKRKYKSEWENEESFKGWLCASDNPDKAFCKLCRSVLRAHKSDLSKHKTSEKHIRLEKELNVKTQPKLEYGPVDVSSEEKKRDLILALHIINHTSIRTIDHLGEILNKHFCKGDARDWKSQVRLHRTKCASIITNVLKPAFDRQIRDEIGDSYFSVLVDESTDVSTTKLMAYCVRYYNKKLEPKRFVTDFLGFQVVERATAEVLKDSFVEFFKDVGLDLNKMVGLGTDGAASLCGNHNSLYTRLVEDYPKLVLLKCQCHSLDKCAQYACAELPSALEYLLRETRNWFCHSALRQLTYGRVYRKLKRLNPPKLTTVANTRWLSFYKATRENIHHWDVLKVHFRDVVEEMEKDKAKNCLTARTLLSMYQDKSNYLYLLFLDSVLEQVNRVNTIFQSDNIDIVAAYNDLYLLIIHCAKRIFKPSYLKVQNTEEMDATDKKAAELHLIKVALQKSTAEFGNSRLPLNNVDYGYKFNEFLSEHKNSIPEAQLRAVCERCGLFMLKLLQEMMDRIPPSLDIVGKLVYFKPVVCLGSKKIQTSCLPWALVPDSWNKDTIKGQWERLQSMSSEDIYGIETDLTTINIVDFWDRVANVEDALGKNVFKELSDFVFLALTLPISNAVVERIFSIMNCVKTRLRNKMGAKMLNSIVTTRCFSYVRKFCCNTFVPSPSMYLLHNKDMYLKSTSNENEHESDDEQALENEENIDEVSLFYDALLSEVEGQEGFATLYAHEC